MNQEEKSIEQALEWVKYLAQPKSWRSYLSAMDAALGVFFMGTQP